MPEFKEFPKIFRLNRECIATEKIDGTCSLVYVGEDGIVLAGSRNKWLSLEDNNYGFAKFVKDNEDDLRTLGPGYHRGEWWGQGIGRAYDLNEKRFSLFNTIKWADKRPKCCDVIPVLARGNDIREVANIALDILRKNGSIAAKGFDRPEGIVIFHKDSNSMFKITLNNDGLPKSLVK